MAVKMALAVGLFIVICVQPGLKASQVVPEGLLYTEVEKTLVRGVQGVITCRFYGDPVAVYWKKGRDHNDQRLMVVWYDGEVSGPRFDDGSCNVDENYSLVINNVSTADSGRMYCTVSNNKGPLMKNYTDILVLDTAITTNPQVTLQLRQATYGILQCIVHIKARRVSWMKGTTSSANEILVVIENNQNNSQRSGARYDDGTYNVTQDYSLVINKLQIHHEGLYVCQMTDDTEISFRNHTFVNVVAHPLEPFPTIQECLHTEQHDSNYCILVAKSKLTLTCQAMMYYPSINLIFLYGSKVLEPSYTGEWNNKDGTKNKTITIATRGNTELYTCVASGIPGTNANKSTSILLQGNEPVNSTLVIILVLFAALILISAVALFIWRKKRHDNSAVTRRASHLGREVHYSSVPRSALHLEQEDIEQDIEQEKDLTEEGFQALEQRVNDVLIKHYRMCYDFLNTNSTIQSDDIVSENRSALFNTHQMLIDWRESRISTRFKEKIDKEKEPDYSWPSNEELKTISRHLTQESVNRICKKLNIDCQKDEANDEGKRLECLRKWRARTSNMPLEEQCEQLSSVLKSNNVGGLLPIPRGPYVYKAELVDFAFHLIIHDLFLVAQELGISATKLASYRPPFHQSHLEIGTIKLLIELREDYSDLILSETVHLHYRTAAITGILEYDISYGELCSISEAINQNTEGCADQATSGMLPGPGIEIPKELANLQDVLQLTDRNIADRPESSHTLTSYALIKIWKEKPRPSVFNYRAALAHELLRIGMPDLADGIIAGTFITEQTSLAFVEDMVREMNNDKIRILGELLQLSRNEERWHMSTPFNEITKQIYDWVADWTSGRKDSWHSNAFAKVTPGMKTTAEKHINLNDKLVEHGFLDLAREIMIIETTTR